MHATYRLPEAWSAPETVEDVIVADEVAIHRAGLSTTAGGEEVCGSAADASGPALSRAWFELLERVSGLEALKDPRDAYDVLSENGQRLGSWPRADVFPDSDVSQRWRYARSNGIAIHVDWETACRRALWELAERDRVIRSWHGEIKPERLALDLPSSALDGARSYEWRSYSFPEEDAGGFSRGVEVVGVFGFPKTNAVPFVLGLAGRPSMRDAVGAATGEALQLLAFLWGEPLPEAPLPTDVGPGHHLDTYQVAGAHEVVRDWLDGGHLEYARHAPRDPAISRVVHGETRGIRFVDLTPEWLPDGLRVAKALCREAVPLTFGDSPFAAHLPKELRIHPIP